MIHTRQIMLVWNKNTEEKTKLRFKWHFNMADPTSEENSSFPYLNPHIIFWVFLSRFHKNALQLLKGSYTFWTLWFLIIVTIGHTTLYVCEKCHRKCHLRTRQPAGWEWDSASIQNHPAASQKSSQKRDGAEEITDLTWVSWELTGEKKKKSTKKKNKNKKQEEEKTRHWKWPQMSCCCCTKVAFLHIQDRRLSNWLNYSLIRSTS